MKHAECICLCVPVCAYLQWRSVWAVWWLPPPLRLQAGGSGCSWPPSCQIQSTGNGPPDWPSWWHWELPCKDIHVWIWREHGRYVQSNIYYTEAQLALSVSFGHYSSWSSIVLRFISLKVRGNRGETIDVVFQLVHVLCYFYLLFRR